MAVKHVVGVFGVIAFGVVEVAGLYHKFLGYVGQTEGNIILVSDSSMTPSSSMRDNKS